MERKRNDAKWKDHEANNLFFYLRDRGAPGKEHKGRITVVTNNMRAFQSCVLPLVSLLFLINDSEALQCYTCMGSTDEDCNRQGSKSCPSYSDACAVVRGHGSELHS
ncbi:hypothetical protein J4Q44_G00015050 [Coregonus suidteri]|uniref:Uncharacterized protein n=1 Tax=Coregonus suidteri TaxID=861788 RepID=A0AAN8RIV6_9TELE